MGIVSAVAWPLVGIAEGVVSVLEDAERALASMIGSEPSPEKPGVKGQLSRRAVLGVKCFFAFVFVLFLAAAFMDTGHRTLFIIFAAGSYLLGFLPCLSRASA